MKVGGECPNGHRLTSETAIVHLRGGIVCRRCLARWARRGNPPTPPIQRFTEKLERDPSSGCWLWTAGLNTEGYGRFWDGQVNVYAHRWSYEHHVGPIPDGLHIDHLCRTRHCVNPAHLEVVTLAENNRRAPHALRARTHCKYGHRYTPANTRRDARGVRHCRTCTREESRQRRAKLDRPGTPRGERHADAVLTAEAVRAIRRRRASGERQIDLAHEYGVNKATVADVVHRRTWKHL